MSRPIQTVHTTSEFIKTYRKLPKHIKELSEKKDEWFRQDAFDARLRTHMLKSELYGFWSYSVNYQYRITFRLLSSNEVIYYDIGHA